MTSGNPAPETVTVLVANGKSRRPMAAVLQLGKLSILASEKPAHPERHNVSQFMAAVGSVSGRNDVSYAR
jgi:hypothetical protein